MVPLVNWPVAVEVVVRRRCADGAGRDDSQLSNSQKNRGYLPHEEDRGGTYDEVQVACGFGVRGLHLHGRGGSAAGVAW